MSVSVSASRDVCVIIFCELTYPYYLDRVLALCHLVGNGEVVNLYCLPDMLRLPFYELHPVWKIERRPWKTTKYYFQILAFGIHNNNNNNNDNMYKKKEIYVYGEERITKFRLL